MDVKECDIEVTKQASCDEPRLINGTLESRRSLGRRRRGPARRYGCLQDRDVQTPSQSEVDITSLDITDVLSCDEWFVADSVVADINGQDITECICPGGACGDIADLSGHKDLTDLHSGPDYAR